jgi:hypothetical protein
MTSRNMFSGSWGNNVVDSIIPVRYPVAGCSPKVSKSVLIFSMGNTSHPLDYANVKDIRKAICQARETLWYFSSSYQQWLTTSWYKRNCSLFNTLD